MIFPIISKFNAEVVKKVTVAMQGTVSNMSFLSTQGQVPQRRTHLTVYACPSYQQVSLAY